MMCCDGRLQRRQRQRQIQQKVSHSSNNFRSARSSSKSKRLVFFFAIVLNFIVNEAFIINNPKIHHLMRTLTTTTATTSSLSNKKHFCSSNSSRNRSRVGRGFEFVLHSNKGSEDEDEDDIDLADRDWRAFRAQLVMDSSSTSSENNEAPPAATSSTATTNTNTMDTNDTTTTNNDNKNDDEDLDGIGSLFFDDFNDMTPTQETPMKTKNFTPLTPQQWAYDSGNVIEQGAVILGGVEQKIGFGLQQQYFHKVVILVLEHDATFTKGIILNRPSDLILVDEIRSEEDDESESDPVEIKWRVWFGGDVQGLDTMMPEVLCLHSLPNGIHDEIDTVSKTVMNDIKYMSFKDARSIVRKGLAKTTDFWVFAGYAGWGPNQLIGELERKSWYMCATDSQTLLKELANQSALTDPRDAGLDTWELLMNLIGRGDTAEESSGDFEDLMLKEWARENLLSVDAGGNAGLRIQPADVTTTKSLLKAEPVDSLIKRTQALIKDETVSAGSLVRAGSNERSPFLLKNQVYHKSIVLMISDDEAISIGVILNQPSTKGLEMDLIDKRTGVKKVIKLPIRFGGMYNIQGQSALMWLHNSSELKESFVGSAVGNRKSGIWQCSQNDATAAIEKGLAKPSDFIIASGLSVWMKGGMGNIGIQGEVQEGNFELIPTSRYSEVWKTLQSQKETLTKMNLIPMTRKGQEAWEVGSKVVDDNESTEVDDDDVVTEGIGEGFDEDNDSYVHNSDVKVGKLSDDARRSCKYNIDYCLFCL